MRSYHHNPASVFHRADEDPEDGCYIGTEIETEEGDFETRVAITQDYGDNEDTIYMMHDGSLSEDGIECITQPMSYKFWQQFDFEGWMEELRDAGARSHDTAHCGLHVHLSREWFGQDYFEQQTIAGVVIHIMQEFKDKLDALARRDSHYWCHYPDEVASGKTELLQGVKNIQNYKDLIFTLAGKGRDRYQCLNTENAETYEFRIFRGTLNPVTYRASVQLCIRLVEYAKYKFYEEDDHDYSWQQFLNFKEMPKELAEYIEIRRQYFTNLL